MKTESTIIRGWRKAADQLRASLLLPAVLLVGAGLGHAAERGLIAHEWGTFTSVQGAEGVLLDWRPLQSSKLPGFVFDLQKSGGTYVNKGSNLILAKGAMVTRQRMETPVVYFYSDSAQTVDVDVHFPQGSITEWYPQAREITLLPPVGTSSAPAESRIHWSEVAVQPVDEKNVLEAALPQDSSGSHYFAARETDAAYVRVNSTVSDAPVVQTEKFLFYRGAGNFPTPLRMSMPANDAVTVANTGTEPLQHLFLIQVREGRGDFIALEPLAPGQEAKTAFQSHAGPAPIAEFSNRLMPQLTAALVAEGLYPREAAAMVKTWQDSWLAEPGTRILYLLPRKWTDATLPMQITPAPTKLVRVMVGRAEMLTPEIEQQLLTALTRANAGEKPAMQETRRLLSQLDRFAEPAFGRALAKLKPTPEQAVNLYALLTPAPEARP